MTDNYVQYVKTERKILAADIKIRELDGGSGIEKKTEHFLTELLAKYALRVSASVLLIVILFFYGRTPVVVLDSHISLKPFDILWTSSTQNSISARGWAAISCLAIRTIRKQILNL
jgi:CHD5-like protein